MGFRTISTPKAERQSNIEFCRILSILLVVLVHSQMTVFGVPRVEGTDTLLVYGLQSLSIIGVNVFVLISGYFSIRLKIKNIVNLLYICLFYMTLLNMLRLATDTMELKYLFFISQSNWFIPRYIGLMILSPVLNAFCDNAEKRKFQYVVIAITLFSFYWGFLLHRWWSDFHNGYSLIHFCILYLIARYFKLHGFGIFNKFNNWIGYITCSLVLTGGAYLSAVNGIKESMIWRIYDYNNPIVLISSICFFISFAKLNISTNKTINLVAQSTLAVLLLHSHRVLSVYINDFYRNLKEQNLVIYLIGMIAVLSAILFISVLIDQLRIKSFNYLYNKIERIWHIKYHSLT
ncbi:MAG: acyltransferase [Bacteroides sp]|nr:acyltransferase [Bacteroides sp.]